jgi:hypothetical protein
MRSHGGQELNCWDTLRLFAAGLVTVATPVIIGVLNAQSRPAAVAPLAFEVASVKPNKSGAGPAPRWF